MFLQAELVYEKTQMEEVESEKDSEQSAFSSKYRQTALNIAEGSCDSHICLYFLGTIFGYNIHKNRMMLHTAILSAVEGVCKTEIEYT